MAEDKSKSIVRGKGVKTVHQGGTLADYSRFISVQKHNNSNFKTSSTGLSRVVEFDSGIKYRFFGNGSKSKNIIKGAYFVKMLRESVDKYVDKYGIVDSPEKPTAQTFNPDAIKKVIGQPITCLDLNLCYWRTAYLLGYINDSLYEKGIESGHKGGMLISIGALNSLPLIEHYEDGKIVSKSYDNVRHSKYSPFYWSIIAKVNDLMMEIYKVIGDDMYMWLTDCAFIKTSRQNEVIAIFEKFGFPFKTYTSDFLYCDNVQVEWFDCKENKKKFSHLGGRLIKPLYNRWKYQHKFYEKNTILQPKTSDNE